MRYGILILLLVGIAGAQAADRPPRREAADRVEERNQRSLDWPDHGQVYVDIVGKLRAGVMTVGGETTGIVVRAENANWELIFGKNTKLRREAERLDGRTVRVVGQLDLRRGVELGMRFLVHVRMLEPLRAGYGTKLSEAPVYDIRRSRDVSSAEGRKNAAVEPATNAGPEPVYVSANQRENPPRPVFRSSERRDLDVTPGPVIDLSPREYRTAPRGTIPRHLDDEPIPDWDDNDDLDEVFNDPPLDGSADEMGTIIPKLDLSW